MAVTGTIAITTILFFVRRRWQRPLWLAVLGAALFLVVELAAGAGHGRALRGRGPAAGLRRRPPEDGSATHPRARHGCLHEPGQGDRAAVDAHLRRSPACAAGARDHPLAREPAEPADQVGGPARGR